jgi:hypothetical protein
MYFRLLKLFVISSLLSLQLAFGACLESAETLTNAVDKLKVQFLCSNDEDLNKCNKLFKSAKKEKIDLVSHNSQSCVEGSASPKVLPLVTPIAEVSKVLEFGSAKRTYVNSHFDFYHHTKLHIQRMNALALELYRKYPSEFPGVDERMIKDVLSYHDRAKIDPNVKFNGKGFYETLYKYYGNVPPRDVIDKLNEYDDGFIKRRLQNLGISNAQNSEQVIKSLERLEKISDSVDRAMNPVSEEEFGRKMWKESKFAKDPTHKSMALYLENNYKELVGDKFYKKMTPDELSELKFRLVVNSQFSDKLSLAQKQMAKSKVTLAKFKKSLNQSFVSKTLKGLGRFALATTAVVDGVLLAI